MSGPLLDLFLDLCALPSPPGRERAVADRVRRELEALGLACDEDGCGPAIGSDTGNLLARVAPTAPGGTPIVLCAHLDTVPLAGPLEPVVTDGVVRNAGGTILGADNKAALAVMIEATRRIVADGRPHAGIELLFTPMEEVGLLGAGAFDVTRLHGKAGFVYDQAAPIGEVVVGAPSAREIVLRFHGQAAHAGMHPEDGRSAIQAAGRAIADMPQGRVDADSTANVGRIRGGVARNIVADLCELEVEARSHDERRLARLVQEIVDAASFAASLGDCTVEARIEAKYRAYRLDEHDLPVVLARAGLARAGLSASTTLSGGAADANVLNEHGLPCVNLANGMIDIHTPNERIAVEDLERMVAVTLGIVDAARETPSPAG